MPQPKSSQKISPTKADYRTVDPFHAFAVIGQSMRDLMVKMKILKPKTVAKPARKSAKPASKARHSK